MRILILSAFFFTCLMYFRKEEIVPYRDTVSTHASALKKMNPTKVNPVKESFETVVRPVVDAVTSNNSEEEIEEYSGELIETGIPWTDIEEGWKDELRVFLLETDPENADKILNAYFEETKKYGAKVDSSNVPEGAVPEIDGSSEITEFQHVENLKEIFGPHFPQVKDLHDEYVHSIQYLNNSPNQISFSL